MPSPRLLLVNPRTPPSFWGLEHSLEIAHLKASNAPLGLITVAALTPEDWSVDLMDENVEPVDLDAPCDLVGIGAMNNQATRAYALADAFRQRGRKVVLGGPLAFAEPEVCARHADVVFVGEAERTWPAFCRDIARGESAARYVEAAHVDLALSPIPRFDLLRRGAYAAIPIQTSRGCPHSCEFCDIIVMMGRTVRTKPVEKVLAEMEAVRTLNGHDSVFFTDDNFNGNVKYARSLLRGLIELRDRTGYKPVLFTQSSLNLAEQTDILELMVRSGFTRVFLGVETPRQASLQETGKRQNLHGDMVARVHTLQRAGLITWAGMIVGFDSDDAEIFAEQAEFLDQAGIAVAMVGMLNALPKTPLHARLAREGRLYEDMAIGDNCMTTNFAPKGMSRAELLRGYAELLEHLYAQERYAGRLMANVGRMGPPVAGASSARPPSLSELQDFVRAALGFTLSPDPRYRRHFLPNLIKVAWRSFPRVVEAAVHLGVWQHFDRYVPHVREAIERELRLELAEVRVLPLPLLEQRAAL